MSLEGIRSLENLSRVVVKSVQCSSSVFPKWLTKMIVGIISFWTGVCQSALQKTILYTVFVYAK